MYSNGYVYYISTEVRRKESMITQRWFYWWLNLGWAYLITWIWSPAVIAVEGCYNMYALLKFIFIQWRKSYQTKFICLCKLFVAAGQREYQTVNFVCVLVLLSHSRVSEPLSSSPPDARSARPSKMVPTNRTAKCCSSGDNKWTFHLAIITYIYALSKYKNKMTEIIISAHKLIITIVMSDIRVFTSFSAMVTPHWEPFSASVTVRRTNLMPAACGYVYCEARWDRRKVEDE